MTIKHLYPNARPSLDFRFARDKRLDPRITFSRASAGTYFDANVLLSDEDVLPKSPAAPPKGLTSGKSQAMAIA